jgi:uncharacterized Rmd1/YagE family protein
MEQTINQSGSSRSSIVLFIVSFSFYLLTLQAALASSKLKDLPKNIERTISAVERQSQELDKETSESTKAERLLRGLFERLA